MNYDYYSEARRLALMLMEEGFNDWSIKVASSLEEGMTSTEILMILRWNLTNFLSSKQGSRILVERIEQLCKRMDIALS